MEEEKEYVDLMIDEVDKPIDKAKFIISNVNYYVRYFYIDKFIIFYSNFFPKYLYEFKSKIKKKNISNKFSFDLLNKSFDDKSSLDISNLNIDNINEIKETKDKIYYDLISFMNNNILKKMT